VIPKLRFAEAISVPGESGPIFWCFMIKNDCYVYTTREKLGKNFFFFIIKWLHVMPARERCQRCRMAFSVQQQREKGSGVAK